MCIGIKRVFDPKNMESHLSLEKKLYQYPVLLFPKTFLKFGQNHHFFQNFVQKSKISENPSYFPFFGKKLGLQGDTKLVSKNFIFELGIRKKYLHVANNVLMVFSGLNLEFKAPLGRSRYLCSKITLFQKGMMDFRSFSN